MLWVVFQCGMMWSSLVKWYRHCNPYGPLALGAIHTDRQVAVLFLIRNVTTHMKRGLKCTASGWWQLHWPIKRVSRRRGKAWLAYPLDWNGAVVRVSKREWWSKQTGMLRIFSSLNWLRLTSVLGFHRKKGRNTALLWSLLVDEGDPVRNANLTL